MHGHVFLMKHGTQPLYKTIVGVQANFCVSYPIRVPYAVMKLSMISVIIGWEQADPCEQFV